MNVDREVIIKWIPSIIGLQNELDSMSVTRSFEEVN